ncbi:unnamed protein product [Bursaphelenchus xylophilus]|uniref:(pine wood nematode) hypothetical protein n=1 Tax=Bursaphelenchus xylophilus TaxID=6326 RepID=A0A1I7RVM9_BURXY|nr:unnamed protein product [Bursaphelenchus xylophilus]CAG9081897.1 unnamed protein product [Bursaphelenchus xylophilus]
MNLWRSKLHEYCTENPNELYIKSPGETTDVEFDFYPMKNTAVNVLISTNCYTGQFYVDDDDDPLFQDEVFDIVVGNR